MFSLWEIGGMNKTGFITIIVTQDQYTSLYGMLVSVLLVLLLLLLAIYDWGTEGAGFTSHNTAARRASQHELFDINPGLPEQIEIFYQDKTLMFLSFTSLQKISPVLLVRDRMPFKEELLSLITFTYAATTMMPAK